ncbi:imaginal disc development protein B4 isoform 1-T2 [Glossina fuscipes fuscipes]
MTDSFKLAEMQRTNIEFERQRHLANWLIKSSPHMATPPPSNNSSASSPGTVIATTTAAVSAVNPITTTSGANASSAGHTPVNSNNYMHHNHHFNAKHAGGAGCVSGANNSVNNPVFYLMTSNGNMGAVGSGGGHSAISTSNVTSNAKHTGAMLAPATTVAGAHHTHSHHAHHHHPHHGLHHLAEGRKAKLRRFNSHDTSSNMFSVADFENARLARRNEIELKQRLQRRMRNCFGSNSVGGGLIGNANSNSALATGNISCDYSTGDSKTSKYSNELQNEPLPAEEFLERFSLPRVVRISYKTKYFHETLQSSSSNGSSTVTSNSSTSATAVTTNPTSSHADANMITSNSNSNTGTSSSTSSVSVTTRGANVINATHTIISNSSSSNNSGSKQLNTSITINGANSSSSGGNIGVNYNNNQVLHEDEQGELFLLYRLVRQRRLYHGHNAKTTVANRKKGVLIPQEFPGYFSLLNDKGMPTATQYTSLIQLVRERVCKFVSVENMPTFTESQPNSNSNPNSPTEGCLNIYSANGNTPTNNRPQYIKTTARGGQVFKLLAVYEDGKQEHGAMGASISCGGLGSAKQNNGHGREKEKSRYAQLLNEQRQTLYVSLATKGKFYEIEPGIPQILQKRLDTSTNDSGNIHPKKINPDCVHRITALITPNKELPITLRYISGPTGCASAIPENLSITRISSENIVIACPIEDVEMQSPLHLRKLQLTKEMNFLRNTLGFESEQRMLANPNVQNILKFCQFNCDQFLKMVEVEILNRSERSTSKSRVDGLKILKPLHFPKLLRREKTTISAHEKEDSIIFLSKSDLANLEHKEQSFDQSTNRITDKMKVFQTTKKKWFRKPDKNSVNFVNAMDLDEQAKRMSMERYSDMSKLLQERFGEKPNTSGNEHELTSEPSGGASDIGCSDGEATTFATIEEKPNRRYGSTKAGKMVKLQKSMSLQDIELITVNARKPDLVASHQTTDTISEAGTDLEDVENHEPLQQSFITEKLYNEFHVKTRQYSKSSSSLHQLLNFSLPQKLQIGDNKRSLAQLKHQPLHGNRNPMEKRLDFNIGEPVTGRRATGGLNLLTGVNAVNQQTTSLLTSLTSNNLIEDDLPYSSVRDSLVLSSDEGSPPDIPAGTIRQALHLIDYAKENIYAEICHEVSAMGGIPSHNHHTRDNFSGATHSTQISDDYGDYASLTYPTLNPTTNSNNNNNSTGLGNAISRVQINCPANSISYHTLYVGEEPSNGDHQSVKERRRNSNSKKEARHARDRSHITTVDVVGGGGGNIGNNVTAPVVAANADGNDSGGFDNIYNTLK